MAVSASRDSRLDSLDDHLGLVACRPGSRAPARWCRSTSCSTI